MIFIPPNQSNPNRVDTTFNVGIADWKTISQNGVSAITAPTDTNKISLGEKWDETEAIRIESTLAPKEVSLMVNTAEYNAQNPFSREYIIGQFTDTLAANTPYQVTLELYLSTVVHVGLDSFGVQLSKQQPNTYDLTPRINTADLNFALPPKYDQWLKLTDTLTAKGGEKYIMVGYFGEEKAIKLRKKRKKIPKSQRRIKHQAIAIKRVKVSLVNNVQNKKPKQEKPPVSEGQLQGDDDDDEGITK